MPSARIEASASSSAVAQSTVRSSGAVEHLRALFADALELAVDVNPSGTSSSASFSSRSRSSGTAVSTFAAAPGRAGAGSRLDESCSGLSSSIARCSSRGVLLDELVGRARLRSRRAPRACRAHSSRTVGCDGDLLVHQRLRERRLVAFVVPVAPVADQVDQEVALERARYAARQPRRLDARFRVVGVDVHDRDLEAARQAARVRRAVPIFRPGR